MAESELPRGTVAVIGPGRVGTVLAIALQRAGHRVVAAGGGSDASRRTFAGRLAGVRTHADPADAARGADLVVLATPDDVLEDVATALAVADAVHQGQRAVHVSGSHGLGALRRLALAGASVAACHPAQTIPRNASPDDLVGAAWAVTAATGDRGWARDLVAQLGGDPHDVPDSARVLYHAALVVGANAVGAAVSVARQLLLAARVDDPAAFLAPLIRASASNVLAHGAMALTGPVVRGDAGTVTRHLAVLEDDLPGLAEAYRHLNRVVLDQARATLAPEQAAALERALAGETCTADAPPEVQSPYTSGGER